MACKHESTTTDNNAHLPHIRTYTCDDCGAELEHIEVKKGVWRMRKISPKRAHRIAMINLNAAVLLDATLVAYNQHKGIVENTLNDMRVAGEDEGDSYMEASELVGNALEAMANDAARRHKDWLLNQIPGVTAEASTSPAADRARALWQEYHDESEHQYGLGYWLQFKSAKALRDDFNTYVKHRD